MAGPTGESHQKRRSSFNVDEDPDYPPTAVNSHIEVMEIVINGLK